MAIAASTTVAVLKKLGVTSVSARTLVESATVNGSAHGLIPEAEHSAKIYGTIVYVHHAGDNLFMVEVS
jgi:hypothetical protein